MFRWERPQNLLWHLLMNFKNNYLLQKLLKWANIKCKNFNIYKVAFFKKNKGKHWRYLILHLCTKNLDDMIHSSWDIECDRLKLVIMGHFLPFYWKKASRDIILNLSYDLCLWDIECDRHYVNLGHSLPFHLTTDPEN